MDVGKLFLGIVVDDSKIKAGMKAAGATVEREAEKTGKEAGEKLSSGLSEGAKAGLAAAGAAAGAAVVGSMVGAMNKEAAGDRVAASLGLGPEDAKRISAATTDIYKAGWGQTREDVGRAVTAIAQQISGMADASDEDLQRVTQRTMDLAELMEQDVQRAAAAVGTMMKTGMAKDADEALDIIAAGFVAGADKQQDLMDTLIEYPTLFRALGLSGQEATGLIAQGLEAGARNSDVLADSLKEFQIRATDGSKASAEAYATLGLNAQQMTAQIAAGGEGAKAGLDLVLDRLRAMQDPVARNAAAVGLFGTKAEDLGAALFAIDPSSAVQGLGEVEGAAGRMSDTLNDNAQTQIEAARRTITDLGISAVEATGPVGAFGAAVGGFLPSIMSVLGPLAMMKMAFAGQAGAAGAATLATIGNTASLVANRAAALASAAAMVVVRGAVMAWTAVQWLLNAALLANPIGLIIVAIVAVVAAIVVAYQKFGWFRDAIGWLWDKIKGVFTWVKDNWKNILTLLTGPMGVAIRWITDNWDRVAGFFKRLPEVFKTVGKTLVSAITWPYRTAFNAVVKLWNATLGRLSFKAPDWVPGIGGKGWALPRLTEVQGLYTGGVVTSPGVFTVGERGPEQVFLPAGSAVVPNGGFGGGAPVINTTINITGAGDVLAVRRQVEAALADERRATVRALAAVRA